jgi:hypothetical protein
VNSVVYFGVSFMPALNITQNTGEYVLVSFSLPQLLLESVRRRDG